jgi:hypothetical protein
VLSTLALLMCLVVDGPARSLCAFAWACLAIATFVLQWSARRRALAPPPRR